MHSTWAPPSRETSSAENRREESQVIHVRRNQLISSIEFAGNDVFVGCFLAISVSGFVARRSLIHWPLSR